MAATKKYVARKDLGKPIDGFFKKLPPATKPIADALRALVEKTAPKSATASIKWGQAFWEHGGKPMVIIGAHKAHVNLILAGPATTYPDPDGLLSGEGTNGRRLVLKSLDDLPKAEVIAWLKLAARRS